MSKFGTETIVGKIVEVKNGEKRINRNYTYGYMSLRVLVGYEYYSVLVATSKLNKYGFLPKIGQWIRVKGTFSNDKEGLYDASISKVTLFEHIEKPR